MRIESFNSYLSAIPTIDHRPVDPIRRENGEIDLPQVKPVASKLVHVFDTMGKAEARDYRSKSQVLDSKLNAAEIKAILKRIGKKNPVLLIYTSFQAC